MLLSLLLGLDPVTLSGGVVVDEDTVYAMVLGGVAALDLHTGTPKWTSSEAAKPYAVVEGHVIALRADGSLASLDADTGALVASCDAPPGAVLGPQNGLGTNHVSHGGLVQGQVVVEWQASTSYAGGVAPTPEMEEAVSSYSQGSFLVDPKTACPRPTELTPPALETHEEVRSNGASVDGMRGDEVVWTVPLRRWHYHGPRPP